MSNTYVIVSTDEVNINENIKRITSKLDDYDLIKYDLKEIELSKVIEDLDTYNLFENKKVIIGNNAYFLSTSKKEKNDVEQSTNELELYLKNQSDNILILITDKLDGKKNIVKLLKSNAEIIDSEININTIIKDKLKDFKMDNYTINYLIEYCGNDNEKIINELDKLMLYKFDEKIITKEDIESIVIKSLTDNIFDLINSITKRNKKKSYDIYIDLTRNGTDINMIIAMLEEQYRIMYNGRILLNENNNDYKKVADIMNIHQYRFQKAIESSYDYSLDDIFKKLIELDNIEIKSRTGEDPSIYFEQFITNM